MQKVANKGNSTADIVEKMFEAGVQYGYSKSRRHPSFSPFIYTTKQSGDIIDLEKSGAMLENALDFVKALGSAHKTILFVGTKPEARNTIKKIAENLEMPYVDTRWIGGTLSNFVEIKKRIAELEKYNKENAEGELQKYTKKERSVLAKKMSKLSKYYSGLIGLKKLPDAIIMIDPKKESIAFTEAKKSDVLVVALANSDTNIKDIDYPLIGNDTGTPSIKFFSEALASAYKEGSMSLPPKK